MHSTNGMPAPPLSVLRLSISSQVAPNMMHGREQRSEDR